MTGLKVEEVNVHVQGVNTNTVSKEETEQNEEEKEQAGISKHVTFHTARHTHATMMLTLGVDLYTVSKLLGHTNIQTTQIYAKLVDESKKKAIDLIPNIS